MQQLINQYLTSSYIYVNSFKTSKHTSKPTHKQNQATHTSFAPMASAQCYKTCEQSCQQKNQHHQQQQHSIFGQKVPELFKGHQNRHPNDGTQNYTQCYGQTEVIYQPSHLAKHQTNRNNCNQTRHNHAATGTTFATGTTTAAKCQGRNRREHKRNNMFQRIKDGISGHSSDSGSSSDESDSDNENRCNRKASTYITSHKKIEVIFFFFLLTFNNLTFYRILFSHILLKFFC